MKKSLLVLSFGLILVLSACTLQPPVQDQQAQTPAQPAPKIEEKKEERKTILASGHSDWAPIMWQQGGQIIGVGPDLTAKIFQELNLDVDVKYQGSWEKVQQKAADGSIDVLVGAYKTPEREVYLDYSLPYTTDPIALFVKKNSKLMKYELWEDLVGKKGLVMTGDSYGQEFDTFIKDKLTVQVVPTSVDAFKALIDGTADYFVYSLYAGQRALATDVDLQKKIVVAPKNLVEENFYIAISKKSPFSAYLSQINDLIQKYKADGTIDNLLKKYQK